MPLTDADLNRLEPEPRDRKLFDGRGLYLLVRSNGARYWRLKYRFAGKEKVLALGVWPQVSLQDARQAADMARDQLGRPHTTAGTRVRWSNLRARQRGGRPWRPGCGRGPPTPTT